MHSCRNVHSSVLGDENQDREERHMRAGNGGPELKEKLRIKSRLLNSSFFLSWHVTKCQQMQLSEL